MEFNMAEILEVLPNLDRLPLLVELTGSCPTFSEGNWGKVVLVITHSIFDHFESDNSQFRLSHTF